MPSRRAVIVSSCEPCASARSKPRPRAHARSACSRERICRALPSRRPAAVVADHRRRHAVRLDQLQRLRVVARRDLDLVALRLEQLRRAAGRRAGARSPSCRPRPSCDDALSSGASRRHALDVVLVPEREREQPPQLAREVLARPRRGRRAARVDRLRLEEPLPRERLRARASRARTARARRAARPRPGSRSRACGRARPRAAAAARPPAAAAASSRGRAPCAAPAARTRSSRRRCP